MRNSKSISNTAKQKEGKKEDQNEELGICGKENRNENKNKNKNKK